jgi:hypothetical protein
MAGIAIYGDEVKERILVRLSHGETLSAICRDPDMPSRFTVLDWAESEEWGNKFARARGLGCDALIDEATEIADDASRDTTTAGNGDAKVDSEWVARSKLRIEQRRWVASKLAPNRYGDRTALQMLDEHGKPAKAGITIIVDGAPGE